MPRLSGLDSSFLALDSHRGVGHLCLVMPLAGRLDVAEVRDSLPERTARTPSLRRRLRTVPLGLGRPSWEDDPGFSAQRHLYESRLPSPGDQHQLAEEVARITLRQLDRRLPLWELHLVDGLDSRRSVLVLKVHHAMIDGIAGLQLLDNLLDAGPDSGAVADPGEHDDLSPTGRDPLFPIAGVADLPLALLRAQARLLTSLPSIAGRAAGLARRPGSALRLLAPRTPFNASLGLERSIGLAEIELNSLRPARTAFRVTVNDILVAATTLALRRWLLAQDGSVERPLRAVVPMAVAPADGADAYGNHLALTLCDLPVDEEGPAAVLARVHEAMLAAKQRPVLPSGLLEDATRVLVPVVAGPGIRLAERLRLGGKVQLPYNLMVSNVPGPAQPYSFCGHRVRGIYAAPPITEGMGLNVAIQGYHGRLHVAVITSPRIVDDAAALAHDIAAGAAEITALAASGATGAAD